MTVITKIKDDKSKEAAAGGAYAPLPTTAVPTSCGDVTIAVPRGSSSAEAAAHAAAARRRAVASQACLLLTALLALSVGFVGAVHIVRQMRAPRYSRGVCSVPIPVDRLMDDSMISGNFRDESYGRDFGGVNGLEPVMTPELVGERIRLAEKIRRDGGVELDYELDLDFEEFEEFEMPQISHGRYLHDFKVNQTAIIDPDGDRCFVMPLDREEVPKPRSFMDIVRNLRDGKYGLDMSEIRVDTRVVLPPVFDLSEFGVFIQSACSGRVTYRLKELEEVIIAKRSVDSNKPEYQFVEFTGKTLVKYNIVNLDRI